MEKDEQSIQNDSIIAKLGSNNNKMERNIFKDLVDIYEQSKLNSGKPQCIFKETLIFDEGWLLRCVLNSLIKIVAKNIEGNEKHDFLPFPINRIIYSKGLLQTPFPMLTGKCKYGEKATECDGMVGQFEIEKDKKVMIKIFENFDYLSIFEAKMYSNLHEENTNAKDYSQVTQIVSCMINGIMNYDKIEEKKIFLIVLYPTDNDSIVPENYSYDIIKGQIKNRINNYKKGFQQGINGRTQRQQKAILKKWNNLEKFETNYEKILELIKIRFITWEDIFNLINTEDYYILKYYEYCKVFNKK